MHLVFVVELVEAMVMLQKLMFRNFTHTAKDGEVLLSPVKIKQDNWVQYPEGHVLTDLSIG